MKKTAREIKRLYLDLIESAPGPINRGTTDVLFLYLYLFVKGKTTREELLQVMINFNISGLAMAYLIEEIVRKRGSFNRHKMPAKYGL